MKFFNKKNNMVPFGKPIINSKEIDEVTKVLKSGIYAHGPISKQFEYEFSKFTKSKFATTVSSCTAGMHLFYFCMGIGRGDEVIVPAQTHTATAHAVELAGAKPVFIDCDIKTGNIDCNQIVKKITKKTKAICVVHFLGMPVNMSKILKIVKTYKLLLIEDCALSLGAIYNKKHTGLSGDAGVFSFYPAKHITTGEGGMIITNKKKVYEKIKISKSLGINKSFLERKTPGIYDATALGFNYRMSEIHAAIGLNQIKKLNSFLKKRKSNFNYLKNKLKFHNNLQILDQDKKNIKNSYYCLNVLLLKSLSKNRMNIIRYLKSKKIGTSIYYPQPVPRMKYYKTKYGYIKKDFKNAEQISDSCISFPVGPHLSKSQMNYLINHFLKILKTYERK